MVDFNVFLMKAWVRGELGGAYGGGGVYGLWLD